MATDPQTRWPPVLRQQPPRKAGHHQRFAATFTSTGGCHELAGLIVPQSRLAVGRSEEQRRRGAEQGDIG
jgi:hypothetical protein